MIESVNSIDLFPSWAQTFHERNLIQIKADPHYLDRLN